MIKKYFLFFIIALFTHFSFSQSQSEEIQLVENSSDIISLRLNFDIYQPPMAHAHHIIKTVNLDNQSKKLLNFSDLFSKEKPALDLISAYSTAYFIKKLEQEHLPKENELMRISLIQNGTENKIKNYQHWNIHADYLQIIFERAQVQPSYYQEQVLDIPLSLLSEYLEKSLFPSVFHLQVGDFLFQDLDCGELCDGINSSTHGYDNTEVSHVGMVVSIDQGHIMVIEAISHGVVLTPLPQFLLRSIDESGHPRVMIGRGDAQIQALIPKAIKTALSYLNQPYNATFSPRKKGFYCSQLITESFLKANHGKTVFALYPMNFKLENSKAFPQAWLNYFKTLKQPIPQDELGSNPGRLSRDAHIHVVYFFGHLRQK